MKEKQYSQTSVNDGYQAYVQNLPLIKNPYMILSPQWHGFRLGWLWCINEPDSPQAEQARQFQAGLEDDRDL